MDVEIGDPFVVGDVVLGCTDSTACNYDSNANIDDGSCDFSCYGCTDSAATNYDPDATIDDGSCFYEELDTPQNLTASAGDSNVTLDWNAPGADGGGGGDDGPCSSTFVVYGFDPAGSYANCWTDGTGYFYFEWQGGCVANTVTYSAGTTDLSASAFNQAFYFYGFDPGATETFTIAFDDGTSAFYTATSQCEEVCGDGICSGSETFENCPEDC